MNAFELKLTREQIEGELKLIFPECDFFSAIGAGDYNFALPLEYCIKTEQIEKLRALGFALSQIKPIVNEPGMSPHLHIWIDLIQSWSKI